MRLEISYEPIDSGSNQPLRLLRKMEGLDSDWQEAGGQMQRNVMELVVMTHGASNNVLSYQTFGITGESEGWREEVAKSEFRPRRESIFLPPGAEGIQVLLTAENWTVLGVAAVTDFRVLHPDATGHEANIWPDPNIEEGENLDQAQGTPRYWQRSGVGKRMAEVTTLPPPAKGHALVIKDDDVRLSATWQAELRFRNQAHGGDTLILKWREAFSVGNGGRSRATFEPMPPGQYVFRVKTVTPFGEPVGSELALTILIPQPLWKRPSTLLLGAGVLAATVAVIVRTAVRRRLQARLDQAERRRRLERERLRIAQDIHDDLGASLTHINLLSQTAAGKMESNHAAWKDTERLRSLAVTLTEKLDEIVWAVSPRHDTLESLLSYLTNLAEEFLGSAGIRARIHVPIQLPPWTLASGLRHNVFLATKEALNNVVKHAQATEVRLQLVIRADAFELTIEDNGCGFSPPLTPPSSAERSARHGLESVKWRIESLGGEFSLDSALGRGTRLTFTVPVNAGEN
jgi:signal transduction histidine kinase